MKRIIAIALCVLMLALSSSLTAFAADDVVSIGGKTYIKVSTAEEFEKMNGSNNYVLANDIDFGGKVYSKHVVPALFTGILNGNGHSIHNFSISSAEGRVGIFNMEFRTDASGNLTMTEKLDDSGNIVTDTATGEPVMEAVTAEGCTFTVQNLTVGREGAPVTAQTSYTQSAQIGIIAGYVADANVINLTNVTVYGEVTSAGQQAGGFFGRIMTNRQLMPSTFTNCKFYGKVDCSGANAAGFVGYSANPINFIGCENHGNISAIGTFNNVGGFVGVSYSAKYCTLSFNGCTNYGKISGVNCVGGFTGKAQYSLNFTNCVNNGEVGGRGTHIGGFAAFEQNMTDYLNGVTVTLTGCVNNAKISSSTTTNTSMGGLVGTVYDHALIVSCINNGNVAVEGSGSLSGGSYVGGIMGNFLPHEVGERNIEEWGENVHYENFKKGEKFTVSISKCINNGDVDYMTGGSGSTAGILGGTIWERGDKGIDCTVIVDSCTNNGNITDRSTSGSSNRVAGIVGRYAKADGIMKITNCLNAGTVKGTEYDTVGGILGYTNAEVNCADDANAELGEGVSPIVRLIRNCLNLGKLLKGEGTQDTYAIGRNYKKDNGTLENCYTVSALAEGDAPDAQDGDETEVDPNEYNLVFGEGTAVIVTAAQLESGEVAYALGEAFGQKLGEEKLPIVGGNAVVKNSSGVIYNKIHDHDFTGSEYAKLNAGSHVRVCNICTEQISEAHVYETASDCGDGTHVKKCKHCGYESSAQAHTCDEYTDNGDGTHSGTCKACGASVSGEHEFDKGECELCGVSEEQAKADAESAAANGSSGEDGADGEKSGCGSSVAIGSVAIVCVLGTAFVFKNKNGEKNED